MEYKIVIKNKNKGAYKFMYCSTIKNYWKKCNDNQLDKIINSYSKKVKNEK